MRTNAAIPAPIDRRRSGRAEGSGGRRGLEPQEPPEALQYLDVRPEPDQIYQLRIAETFHGRDDSVLQHVSHGGSQPPHLVHWDHDKNIENHH